MVSVQRMRMLLPNVHINLDAQRIRPVSQLLDNLLVRHGVEATDLVLDDLRFLPACPPAEIERLRVLAL
jgi:hypothetical protein